MTHTHTPACPHMHMGCTLCFQALKHQNKVFFEEIQQPSWFPLPPYADNCPWPSTPLMEPIFSLLFLNVVLLLYFLWKLVVDWCDLFCGFNCTKATTLLNPDEPWFLVQASAIKIWPYNVYHTCYVGLDFFRLSEVMIHGTVSVGQESITAGLQLEVVRWVGAQSFHLQVLLHFFWTQCHSSWRILRWGVLLKYCNRKRMTKWSHSSDVFEAFWNWQL